MRAGSIGIIALVLGSVFSGGAFAQKLPACNTEILSRHGNHVTVKVAELERMINQRLQAAHSHVSGLELAANPPNRLNISATKDGTPFSISGPVEVKSGGMVQLHANHISKNGSSEKGIMDFFGKELDDYVHLKHTAVLSVDGDNVEIQVDRLLGTAADVSAIEFQGRTIELDFASQPCR